MVSASSGSGILALGALIALLVAWRVVRMVWQVRSATTQIAQTQGRDHGMALVGIITGTDDYGSWPPDAPRKMLSSSWSITDHGSAVGNTLTLGERDAIFLRKG